MYQVIIQTNISSKFHVIAECATKEQALNKFMELVEANKGSSTLKNGSYSIRKKAQ
ncbi:hypothetical protein Syn7502_03290 [Synechococcus sp. PCC 7502]|uniref:hypothetical protein n=1 Tax=Synechococcus sp. PCC 7502 TaxID=1173263 RepID=UPI00029FE014|nr:hypothetical protein [Synechococcus sp. PCC 7502]AFY75156.1 hypothetical protein Syn7502_03290 [Synechococcus sp. PCC 7502]